ncbi:MAG: hypothetical protein ACLFVR_05865 [Thiohalospira sp.]
MPPIIPVKLSVRAEDSMIAGIFNGFIKAYWSSQTIKYGFAAGISAKISERCRFYTKEVTDKIYN